MIQQPNINPETGVHFGVCNSNSEFLPKDWFYLFKRDCCDCRLPEDTPEDNDDGIDPCEYCEIEYYICNKPDFKAEYNSNTNIIMIFYSKKTITCNLCSPCYPNAGDLDSPSEMGVKTYTFND